MKSKLGLFLLLTLCALAARYPTAKEQTVEEAFQRRRGTAGRLYVFERLNKQIRVREKGRPDRVVWSEPEQDGWYHSQWSEDGTHLALFEGGINFRLRVWSPGSMRAYPGGFLNSEGPFDVAFSPDSRALLLRVARVQGMFDVNIGQLYSLDLMTGKSVYWEEYARKVVWRDTHRFTYWSCHIPENGDGDSDHWPTRLHEADTGKPPTPLRSPPVWH